jgi:hypothetical protein
MPLHSYLPNVVFGAPPDKYTQNLNDPSIAKFSPKIRVSKSDPTEAHVNLNLFPLSKEPMPLCIKFNLPASPEKAVVWHKWVFMLACGPF